MLRYRREAERADVIHWQWLSVEQLDAWLLPPKRPRLLTAHNVIGTNTSPMPVAMRSTSGVPPAASDKI